MSISENSIALFEWQEVRKIRHDDQWWFVVIDVVAIVSNSKDPQWYLKDMRRRDKELSKGWGQIATPLEIMTNGGKQKINCANTQWILRIIQSIPSARAEPFKLWLAQVWYERIQEIDDPELSMQRMIQTYEKKWYPKDWIDIRTRWIPVRKWLTAERDQRWWDHAYGLLTNEIYQAYSWMTNQEWMNLKSVDTGNLRDAMTPTELILTMLAEQAATDITKSRNANGLSALKKASKDGWSVALKARKELIQQTGQDPITDRNYLSEHKETKKIIKK